MTVIEMELPIRTESEANVRECWQSKHRRARDQRGIVKMALYNHRRKMWGKGVVVTLTRIAPRPLDGDNLQRSFKAVRDQVAEEIGIDDGSGIYVWRYAQERGKPKEYAVRIEIEGAA